MEITITTQNYDEITTNSSLTVIDFWATWCGPCKRLAPIIEELASEYEGKAVVGKCEVEENDELAEKFNIMNVPTVVFIKNGEEVDRLTGLSTKNVYQEKINSLL